jgi:hypothetical protein
MDQLNCRTDQNKNHTRTHEHLNWLETVKDKLLQHQDK